MAQHQQQLDYARGAQAHFAANSTPYLNGEQGYSDPLANFDRQWKLAQGQPEGLRRGHECTGVGARFADWTKLTGQDVNAPATQAAIKSTLGVVQRIDLDCADHVGGWAASCVPGPSCGGSCGRRECPLMPLTLAWNPLRRLSMSFGRSAPAQARPYRRMTLAKLQAQVAATHPSGTVALGAGGNAWVSLLPGLPAVNLPAAVGPATPEPIDVGGGRAVAEPAKALPQVTLKAEDFGLEPTAAQPPPAPPTSQMTGIPRAIAFPASNIASTAISTFGVPGDIVRGVGALAGEKAATDLQGAPLPLAPAPLLNLTPSPSGNSGCLLRPRSGWPTWQLAALFTPQCFAAAPGKQDVQPWMGNTPISSESLLALRPTLLG